MIARLRAWLVDYLWAVLIEWRHFRAPDAPRDWLTGDRAPVLLLPGVYETWRFLEEVGERLHALGHPVHVVTALRHNSAPIASSADLTWQYLVEHDLRGVLVVAHSKGGLIGKHMMVVQDIADDRRIDRMLAVAAPFSGSPWANFAPIPTLRAFRPRDRLVTMLNADAASNARIVSVSPRDDQFLPTGSSLPGAENVELPVSGHFRVLVAPELLDVVERFASAPDARSAVRRTVQAAEDAGGTRDDAASG